MEVHHHPHHAKKKFKDFFLEFIMIFLAVTLGFIAENVRESISNHEREKHYVESLVNDLTKDTVSMHIAINENKGKIDSLKRLARLKNADFSKIETRINLYNTSRMIGDFGLFKSNDATMMQLKTSGLQLIKRHHVADSIAGYDAKLKMIDAAEAIYFNGTNAAMEASQQLLDLSASDDTTYFDRSDGFKRVMLPLYLDNTSSLPRFFNKVDFEIGATRLYIYNIQRVLPYAERLIAYLKKEYKID